MIAECLGNLACAAGGRLVSGRPDTLIKGLFSDTRMPVRGGMFVALRGENFDGNKFASEAVKKLGAAAVLLDKPDVANALPKNAGAILVEDSRQGYLGIAAAHRQKLAGKIWFGITGSVGKSTTKEMLAHVLSTAARWKIHKADKSFNNAVGLSHTILGAAEEHQAVVLELGTNHPGEIRQLASVARPNIALITCAAESHLEAFKNVEGVAHEKSEILGFQQPADVAVLNADSPHLPIWLNKAAGRVLTFGFCENAEVKAKHVHIDSDGCAHFMARHGDDIADCVLHVAGMHQVSNALAVLAASVAAGVRLDVAARALGSFGGIARRFTVSNLNGVTLIDDAYNANPASFTAALQTLKAMTAHRKIVVAGDMLELGPGAERYHLALGPQIVDANAACVLTVGDLASLAGAAAVGKGLPRENWIPCATPEDAAERLNALLSSGDVVLVKGSNGMRLDRCCKMLCATRTGSAN